MTALKSISNFSKTAKGQSLAPSTGSASCFCGVVRIPKRTLPFPELVESEVLDYCPMTPLEDSKIAFIDSSEIKFH
jgi:hypothetical protein